MNALICSRRMPEFDRECGSKRIFDIVQILREAGWDLTFVAREGEPRDRYARALRRDGIPAYVGFETLSDDRLARSRFDVAILAFWHVAEACLPRIRRLSPGTRIIVDSVDVHFLRSARGAFTRPPSDAAMAALPAQLGDEFVREVNAYAAADGLLAVSPKEAALIGDLIGTAAAVRCVPLCEELPRSTLPFADRKGLLFVGNFWHQPNVEAVHFLVREILPRIHPQLLADHPLSIVGNASADKVAGLGRTPQVQVVGWVPTVLPYLSRARVMTVPLRHGAGTKGKLIQSLAVGTPVVATSVGIEGLDVLDARDVVVADEPTAFAKGIELLLTNEELWNRLADCGHVHVAGNHSREVVRERLLAAIDHVLTRPCNPMASSSARTAARTYEQVRDGTLAAIGRSVPARGAVAVISKGDPALLKLENRRGEHFPQLADGRYAGSYPANGHAAVAALNQLKGRGVEFLAIPRTSLWWLEHYKELADFLERTGSVVSRDDDCLIYSLSPATSSAAADAAVGQPRPRKKRRPTVPPTIAEMRPELSQPITPPSGAAKPRVLVLGIYLCGQRHNAVDEIATIRASTWCRPDQRWVALGGPAEPEIADVTVAAVLEKTPKFGILNRLIGGVRLADYDYLVSVDDDIVLPYGFLDAFISLQHTLGFALAQPARTSDSYLDHPIVEQQQGLLARQTRFVEIGPVFSLHRSIYDALLPFDLTSSMGWGYENVWAYRLQQRGLKMGIIDAVPVCHGLRKSVVNYSWHHADAERTAYWARHPHLPLDECFRVVDIAPASGGIHA